MRTTRLVSLCPMMAVQGSFAAEDGASLYRERCAQCHDGGVPRAPTRDALRGSSADSIRSVDGK